MGGVAVYIGGIVELISIFFGGWRGGKGFFGCLLAPEGLECGCHVVHVVASLAATFRRRYTSLRLVETRR